MSKITKVEVHYAGKVDKINVKRLKYSQQMRLFTVFNQGSYSAKDEDGKLARDEAGNQLIVRPAESVANFNMQLIVATVCDDKGKPSFTLDQVDDWGTEDNGSEKITAYVKAINLVISPNAGAVAGNLKPTVTGSSSSA